MIMNARLSALSLTPSLSAGSLRRLLIPLLAGLSLTMAGCSGSPKAKPAKLIDFQPSLSLKTAWAADVGRVNAPDNGIGPFTPAASAGLAVSASPDGQVRAFDLVSGQSKWTLDLKTRLVAGVGSGGGTAEGFFAVVSEQGDLILIDSKGSQRWRIALGGVALEKPALSAGQVVVRLADNRLTAFDLETGSRRWVLQRSLPPLVLHGQSGLRAMPTQDLDSAPESLGPGDLLANLPGGRLVWVNAATGAVRWEAQVAVPRGSNEVERISDLIGSPAVAADMACVTAYQTQVSCLSVETGRLAWQKSIDAMQPPALDRSLAVVVDSSSRVVAFDRRSGESVWREEGLFLRRLSAPVSMGDAIWLVDFDGYLHGLSRESGKPIARQRLDGGRLAGPMVLTRQGLLIQTAGGRLMLLRV